MENKTSRMVQMELYKLILAGVISIIIWVIIVVVGYNLFKLLF